MSGVSKSCLTPIYQVEKSNLKEKKNFAPVVENRTSRQVSDTSESDVWFDSQRKCLTP
jgi:hypothetical protein